MHVQFSHNGLYGAWRWQYRRGRRVLQQAVKISNVLARRRHAVRLCRRIQQHQSAHRRRRLQSVIAVLHLKTEVTAIGGFRLIALTT